MFETFIIRKRGWYVLANGRFVEVVHVNKYGHLTVALNDKEDRLYGYFNDGMRSAYGDRQLCIVNESNPPLDDVLNRQRQEWDGY